MNVYKYLNSREIMNEIERDKTMDKQFIATNKRMDELISVVMDMRDQFKYLKAEIRASNQRLEVSEEKIDTLEKQVNELRISR